MTTDDRDYWRIQAQDALAELHAAQAELAALRTEIATTRYIGEHASRAHALLRPDPQTRAAVTLPDAVATLIAERDQWQDAHERLIGAFELHMDIIDCQQALSDYAGIFYDVALGALADQAEQAQADALALRACLADTLGFAWITHRNDWLKYVTDVRQRANDLITSEHPGAVHLAERRALLVVAYEAYKLSLHISEFETVVDEHTIEALDRALLSAFGLTYDGYLLISAKIEDALGGYEATLAARRAAVPPYVASGDDSRVSPDATMPAAAATAERGDGGPE